MRFYRLKRETTEGDFGLYNGQLYVGQLSDPDGNRLKGIAILTPNRFVEIPVALAADDARAWVKMIDGVTPDTPLLNFQVPIARFWNFKLTLDKHLDSWLGGSGYSGSVFLGYAILGQWFPIKMSAGALNGLRDCLIRFYGL